MHYCTMALTSFYPASCLSSVLLFACLWISENVSAQLTDLEKEIMSYQKSTPVLVDNGRLLLRDSYIAGNVNKVNDLRQYLWTLNDTNYVALLPEENRLLKFRTNEFESLLEEIGKREFDKQPQLFELYEFLPDDLLQVSIDYTIFYRPLIEVQINGSSLSEVQKAFLLIYLIHFIRRDNESVRKELHVKATDFLTNWPSSEYADLVRPLIQPKVVLSNWGGAIDFFMGYNSFSGKLGRELTGGIAIGAAFDISYKKIDFYFRNQLSFHTLVREPFLSINNSARESLTCVIPEFSMGYPFFENNGIKLSPFLGIAGLHFSNGMDVEGFTKMYVMGVNLNVKMDSNRSSDVKNSKYTMLRVRYTYGSPQFGTNAGNVAGKVHAVQIAVGAKWRGKKIVKP
jgi:hypothetical protein